MTSLRAIFRSLLGFDRRSRPREVQIKQDLERRHWRIARRLSKINGHTAEQIIEEAVQYADRPPH